MAPVVRGDQGRQARIPGALQVVLTGQVDQQQPVRVPTLAHRFRDELVIAIVTAAHV